MNIFYVCVRVCVYIYTNLYLGTFGARRGDDEHGEV